MIKTTVKGSQSVVDALRHELNKFASDSFVLVGIQEDAGNHSDAGMTNAQLGATLNYGTATIPPRPWLEPGVSTGNRDYLDTIEKGVKNGQNLGEILNIIGVQAVANVQNYMIDLRTPPNAPSTIAAKKSSNPLIDTGELKNSINYKIVKGAPTEGF